MIDASLIPFSEMRCKIQLSYSTPNNIKEQYQNSKKCNTVERQENHSVQDRKIYPNYPNIYTKYKFYKFV